MSECRRLDLHVSDFGYNYHARGQDYGRALNAVVMTSVADAQALCPSANCREVPRAGT